MFKKRITRRKFVKTGLTAGAAVVVGAPITSATSTQVAAAAPAPIEAIPQLPMPPSLRRSMRELYLKEKVPDALYAQWVAEYPEQREAYERHKRQEAERTALSFMNGQSE